jgi:hypothetical protein
MKALRVRIIDSASSQCWYRDRIGQEFWVETTPSCNTYPGEWHHVIDGKETPHFIERQDFEILREAEVRVETVTRVVEITSPKSARALKPGPDTPAPLQDR